MLPLHPSPGGVSHRAYKRITGYDTPVFLDLWPMWRVPLDTTDCMEPVFSSHVSVLDSELQPHNSQLGGRQMFCVTFSREPILLEQGRSTADVDGFDFPVPAWPER